MATGMAAEREIDDGRGAGRPGGHRFAEAVRDLATEVLEAGRGAVTSRLSALSDDLERIAAGIGDGERRPAARILRAGATAVRRASDASGAGEVGDVLRRAVTAAADHPAVVAVASAGLGFLVARFVRS